MSLREVYHATSLYATTEMISTGKIRLSGMAGKKHETTLGIGTRRYMYFLSLTRSKIGGYHVRSVGNYYCLIVFDYDALNHRYHMEPVDYWGREMRRIDKNQNEMEERLFANQQYIPIQGKIKSIHVLIEPKWTAEEMDKVRLRRLMIEGKKKSIKVYVYNNRQKWRSMKPALALKQSELDLTGKEKKFSNWRSTNFLNPYVNLYYAPTKKALSERGRRLAYNLAYSEYRQQEERRSLDQDLHNSGTKPHIAHISKLILKEGGVDKFFSVLVQKAKTLFAEDDA